MRELKAKKKSVAEKTVARYEGAHEELTEFMNANEDIMAELRLLIEERNTALVEAVAAVKNELKNSDKDKLVIGSIGAIKKKKEYWDGSELAATIPGEISQHFLKERLSYEVNTTKLLQLIRQGEVDKELAYRAFHKEPPTLALMAGAPKEIKL